MTNHSHEANRLVDLQHLHDVALEDHIIAMKADDVELAADALMLAGEARLSYICLLAEFYDADDDGELMPVSIDFNPPKEWFE